MALEWRGNGRIFAAGLLAGAVVVAAIFLLKPRPEVASPSPPQASVATLPSPTQTSTPNTAATEVVITPARQPFALATSCPSQPLAAVAGEADGRFALQAALSNQARPEPGAFLAVAREAAEQGRRRDAEVALLAACHFAEQASGRQSAPLADVKSQLGQQYVALAASEASAGNRDTLLRRATELLQDSASTYAVVLGKDASRTRQAELRLAALQQPEALGAALNEQGTGISTMGAAAAEAPRPVPALVLSDPELSQMESDLQRLQAQAASVTRDPGGMRQRQSRALAERDAACQDKACLLRWYAQRRVQLLDEF